MLLFKNVENCFLTEGETGQDETPIFCDEILSQKEDEGTIYGCQAIIVLINK